MKFCLLQFSPFFACHFIKKLKRIKKGEKSCFFSIKGAVFCSQKGKLISIIRQLNLRSKALYIRGLGREAQWNILQCFNFSKLFTFSILSRLKYHPRITFKNTLVFPLFQNLLSFDIFHSNLS